MKHHCIYRAFKKRFSVPLVPLPQWHRPCFQLAHDGWSNAIRSNFSSTQAPTLSLTQTPHRHTLLKQEGKTQLCFHPFTPPFVPPSIHPHHWSSFTIPLHLLVHSCILLYVFPSPAQLSALSSLSPLSIVTSVLYCFTTSTSASSSQILPDFPCHQTIFISISGQQKKCTALVNPGSLSLPLHQLHTSLQLNCL